MLRYGTRKVSVLQGHSLFLFVTILSVMQFFLNRNDLFPFFSKIKLLNQFCGTEDDLPIKKKFYTSGRVLKITWLQAAINRTSEIAEGSGFSLTLTSVSKPPGNI